jgi:hypothetical protein
LDSSRIPFYERAGEYQGITRIDIIGYWEAKMLRYSKNMVIRWTDFRQT